MSAIAPLSAWVSSLDRGSCSKDTKADAGEHKKMVQLSGGIAPRQVEEEHAQLGELQSKISELRRELKQRPKAHDRHNPIHRISRAYC